jgi:hypothetical protein
MFRCHGPKNEVLLPPGRLSRVASPLVGITSPSPYTHRPYTVVLSVRERFNHLAQEKAVIYITLASVNLLAVSEVFGIRELSAYITVVMNSGASIPGDEGGGLGQECQGK